MQLVRFHTPDGIELHGALHAPAGNGDVAADAAIFLHGAGSNFYSSSLLAGVLPTLSNQHAAVLAMNTRGHDSISTLRTSQGGRRGGTAYEVVDECRHDVRGGVDFLVQQGHRKIALVGHSLGALKAIYSQAHDAHENVSHIIAISPPRLSYAAFCRGPRREEFLATIATAQQHVDSGSGETLMEITIPLPLLITAAGYLDKYGPGERYNIAKFAQQVRQPALYMFGEKELSSGAAAFAGMDDEIRQLAESTSSPVDVAVISQADHFYTGCHEALADAISQRLARRDP